MNGYRLQAKLNDAVELLEMVKGQGLELDVVAYNIFVSGFTRFGEVERTLDFINDMRLEGLEPHQATDDLISGYFKAKLFKKAHDLFSHMKCIGVKADVKTYTVQIDGRLIAALLGMPHSPSKADQKQ
ncbi:hypothetical protein Droror1_Dr00025095 [Drosera rotundifolia]